MNSKRKILTPGIRAGLIGLAMLGLLVSGWPGRTPTRVGNTHFSPRSISATLSTWRMGLTLRIL